MAASMCGATFAAQKASAVATTVGQSRFITTKSFALSQMVAARTGQVAMYSSLTAAWKRRTHWTVGHNFCSFQGSLRSLSIADGAAITNFATSSTSAAPATGTETRGSVPASGAESASSSGWEFAAAVDPHDARWKDRLDRRLSGKTTRQSKIARVREYESSLGEEQLKALQALKENEKVKDWEGAFVFLDGLPRGQEGLPWMPIYRNVLKTCCHAHRVKESYHIFNEFVPVRDTMCYSMMISMCSRLRRLDEVDSLVRKMGEDGLEMSGVTICSLIGACAESNKWEDALHLFKKLKTTSDSESITNWEVAYLSVMTACSRAGKRDRVKELLDDLRQSNVGVAQNHYNVCMASCVDDGAAAMDLFKEMQEAGFKPRVMDWRVLVSCHGSTSEQWRLYEEMVGLFSDQEPLETIWATMLRSAVNLEDGAALRRILQAMRDRGIDPNSDQVKSDPSLKRALQLTWKYFGRSKRAAEEASTGVATKAQAIPIGWSSAVDPGTGQTYYWQEADPENTTTWALPSPARTDPATAVAVVELASESHVVAPFM
eukprot:TRINITY_DN3672_c0_g1_i2.p1 TRINITY_DN3672_c0_g1~~TRINITY_DN3672_c0_g1_i2.p1  ORF type:complete len:580 (-),score=79.09 TRINITY_DN3672_c0_g1_i2:186-1823(-)